MTVVLLEQVHVGAFDAVLGVEGLRGSTRRLLPRRRRRLRMVRDVPWIGEAPGHFVAAPSKITRTSSPGLLELLGRDEGVDRPRQVAVRLSIGPHEDRYLRHGAPLSCESVAHPLPAAPVGETPSPKLRTRRELVTTLTANKWS